MSPKHLLESVEGDTVRFSPLLKLVECVPVRANRANGERSRSLSLAGFSSLQDTDIVRQLWNVE
jgi:hypothetical protein